MYSCSVIGTRIYVALEDVKETLRKLVFLTVSKTVPGNADTVAGVRDVYYIDPSTKETRLASLERVYVTWRDVQTRFRVSPPFMFPDVTDVDERTFINTYINDKDHARSCKMLVVDDIGFAFMRPYVTEDYSFRLHVDFVYVNPHVRRRGCGTCIIKHICHHTYRLQENCQYTHVTLTTEDPKLFAWYRRLGFSATSETSLIYTI
jgi:GNAT superfamily N-acetyltransferase